MAINKDEISLDREALKAAAADYHAAHARSKALGECEGGVVMGGMTETCGAIAGGIMALGQVRSSGFDAPGSKRCV